MLTQIAKNRRLWLLLLMAGLVLVTTRWALTPSQSFNFVAQFGYWCMLALVILLGRAVAKAGAGKWVRDNFGRFDAMVLVLVVVCTSVWWSHEKPGFKILADELLLLGTSVGMHHERYATYPSRATDVQGPFQIIERVLDKRPLLFPFLVSTVHDLTGYRVENGFYFNRGLGIAFLLLVYVLGWQMGGRRWAGVLALLLFAGLPLAAQQSAGCGFELLNLFFMAAFMLGMLAYLRRPDALRLEVMVYTALALAACRYESILFMGPMALAALIGWWRRQRIDVSWPVLISPVFLAMWLTQNRIFSGDSTAWQMASKEGTSSPFGLEYLVPNFGHALAFFFDFDGYQPSSAIFAALGLLALPFLLLWVVRKLRTAAETTADELTWILSGAGLFGITAIMLLYFWGQFDDRIINRLSLPTHLFMMLAIVVVVRSIAKTDRVWKWLTGVVAFAAIAQSLPVMAKLAYEVDYSPGLEMKLREKFLKEQPEKDFLVLDNDAVFWIVHGLPSAGVIGARDRAESLAYHLRNHSFSGIYVFQTVRVNSDTGAYYIDPTEDMGPQFELETVWQQKTETLMFVRFSRIISVDLDGETVREVRDAVPTTTGHLNTPEQIEEIRTLYLENWIKQLP
ncbi:hypothetical protein [Synoicihabitans lomoniglobus]|uniref:Glycosyltransferase family 39 protein n=1 Tax=Synoicihabitans lomoniglobus TaxID=2909285 RepID=A0AAE9ZYJ5_9BACT|nr:glycosyltransferase family 39 protein [Opitutaceae bacterium LMO-M01]WED65739.1 glycosyltransferase family 39 protein [Opitutaceae bacterium LMO-M01]